MAHASHPAPVPSAPRNHLRAAALALLALAGCGRNALGPGAAHPALMAADGNRDRLLGQVVVGNFDRTLATADALKGDGLLPFGGAELRQMLLASLKIEQKLFDLVDTAKPITFAFVAPAPAAKTSAAGATPPATPTAPPPLVAGVVTLRGLNQASQALAAVGALGETRKDAQRFTRPDGTSLWVLRVGGQVLFSDSFESLTEAGSHALNAPQAGEALGADDLVAILFPAALTRADGGAPGVKARALSAYEQELRDRGQAMPPAERASIDAALDTITGPMSETDRLRIGVGLGRERGVGVTWHATPRPGTPFAQRLAAPAPYQIPAGVQGRGDLVSVLAFGPLPVLPTLLQSVVDKQAAAAVPGAAPVAARLRTVVPMLSGAYYQGVRAAGDRLGVDMAFGLRSGVAPAAAANEVAALFADPGLPVLLQQLWGRYTPRIEVKRAAPRTHVTFVFPESERPGGPAAIARAFSGKNELAFVIDALPGRIVIGTEPGAAEQLRTLASFVAPAAGAGAAPLAQAVAESAGREGVYYFDLWGFARPVLRASLAGNQRRVMDMILAIPGLGGMSLPMWLSIDGGKTFSAELRVPIATLRNASTLMGLLGGTGVSLGAAP